MTKGNQQTLRDTAAPVDELLGEARRQAAHELGRVHAKLKLS
jgi:hypothetical protein